MYRLLVRFYFTTRQMEAINKVPIYELAGPWGGVPRPGHNSNVDAPGCVAGTHTLNTNKLPVAPGLPTRNFAADGATSCYRHSVHVESRAYIAESHRWHPPSSATSITKHSRTPHPHAAPPLLPARGFMNVGLINPFRCSRRREPQRRTWALQELLAGSGSSGRRCAPSAQRWW